MTEMNEMARRGRSFLIVGAHFRPPAKALLATLPGGAELWLLPEPSNPYDAHAVKVLVNIDQYSPEARYNARIEAVGFGFDLEQLLEGEAGANAEMAESNNGGWWHIGYIPAQKPGKNGEPESVDDIDWNIDHVPPGGLAGRLTFDALGKPMVTVSPWPQVPSNDSGEA